MKQPYPVRHRPSSEAARSGATTAVHDQGAESPAKAGTRGGAAARPDPRLPHEHDESSRSQASASRQQRDIGKKAYANATDGSADTDRGPVLDEVYNEKVAPDRSSGPPRE